jgi:5-methylthioadenosine/S-adenosylhomocysteine deaminase
VQAKAVLRDETAVESLLNHPDVQVLRKIHYRQYDTYFMFDDAEMGRVRYREDDNINEKGDVESVRSRLTLTMPTKEREYNSTVLLSHSRFIAPADRPLRFYREYFQPPRSVNCRRIAFGGTSIIRAYCFTSMWIACSTQRFQTPLLRSRVNLVCFRCGK